MPYQVITSPTDQIHDAIIASLQALPIVTGIIPANRINRWFDNRNTPTTGTPTSLGALSPTNIRVFCDDEGELQESVGPCLYTFTLCVSVITGQDLPPNEILYNLGTPHMQHEAIVGAVWYAWNQRMVNFPNVTGLDWVGNSPFGEWIYLGKASGADSEEWFETHLAWKLNYVRSNTQPAWSSATSTTTSTSTSTATATATAT